MKANPLVNVYRLEVGTTLCIPVSTPQGNYTNFTTYLVQEGDSLGSILSSDTFNLAYLMQLNDPNDIMLLPGSTLKLPITGTGESGVTL
jgi:LysM repeat protein